MSLSSPTSFLRLKSRSLNLHLYSNNGSFNGAFVLFPKRASFNCKKFSVSCSSSIFSWLNVFSESQFAKAAFVYHFNDFEGSQFILNVMDPLLVKAARGEPIIQPPAWMMHQAGRYMAVYRKLAEKYPSFGERSETTDLIVKISLQPWEAFSPDGVIIFLDIITPLPAFGVPFDIEQVRGPVIQKPIISEECLKALHPIDLENFISLGSP
ncbi:hypothetical protein SLE2022_316710 [Rubroshorea leprosula]